MSEQLKACPFCGSAAKPVRYLESVYVQCQSATCGACGSQCGSRREAITAWNIRATDAENQRLRAEVEALREALVASEQAISEYYRYWTGGETRGSYDGKPERNGLWNAMYKARAALDRKAPQ